MSKAVVKDITKNRKNVFHVKKIVLNVQTDLIVKNVKDLRTYIKEIVFHLVQNIGHQSHKFVKKMDLQIIVIWPELYKLNLWSIMVWEKVHGGFVMVQPLTDGVTVTSIHIVMNITKLITFSKTMVIGYLELTLSILSPFIAEVIEVIVLKNLILLLLQVVISYLKWLTKTIRFMIVLVYSKFSEVVMTSICIPIAILEPTAVTFTHTA